MGWGWARWINPKYLIQEGPTCSSGLQDSSNVVALLCFLGRSPMAAFQISSSLKEADPKCAVCATLLWQMQQCWVSHVTSQCLARWNGDTHGNGKEPCSTFPEESCVCTVKSPRSHPNPAPSGPLEHGAELTHRKTYKPLRMVAKIKIFPWGVTG